jgi:phosphoribosylanthranilate isomerase
MKVRYVPEPDIPEELPDVIFRYYSDVLQRELGTMLTQIYEVSTVEEAAAISAIGVDHIGVLVGDGRFPRELPIAAASDIGAAIIPPSKFSALFLNHDISLIAAWARELKPSIVHLGASAELLSPNDVALLKGVLPGIVTMRSIPVFGEESIAIACSYVGVADFLLLDSYRPADKQIGALGVAHDWNISRRIVDIARVPVVLAGGLGPDNVAEAVRTVRPAGVDSKTRTDRDGSHAKDLERVRRFHEAARASIPCP